MFITRRIPTFLFSTGEEGGAGQAPTEVTPDTAGHEAGTEQQPTQQEIDWAKRYSDLQPEYTRTTQELSQARQREDAYQALLYSEDQDTRRQAAQVLGIELDEPELEDTSGDPYLTREEWEAYQQREAQTREQQAQEQGIKQVESYMDTQLETLGVPAHLRSLVKADAVFNRDPNGDGLPDIKGAFENFTKEIRAQEKREWAKSKPSQFISSSGREGTNAPPLNTHEDRVAYMVQLAHDAEIG